MRITKTQFAGLDQYKYSGIDKSVVSRHILGPFWNWLVTCFPKTLAPNTVRQRHVHTTFERRTVSCLHPMFHFSGKALLMRSLWFGLDYFLGVMFRLCQCWDFDALRSEIYG